MTTGGGHPRGGDIDEPVLEGAIRPGDQPTARAFIELRDEGLLWLINRVVFHPRGYALALVTNDATGEALGWVLQGDGSEPWSFPVEDESEKFAAVEALLSRRPSGGESQ